jgi:hypothetical protein
MKNTYHDIGTLLNKLNEEELVDALPVFSRMVTELIDEIKKAEGIRSAETAFDLLMVISSPLATLKYKYNRELPPDLMEVLKIEGYLFPDQNGSYTGSREALSKSIKKGEIFKKS